MLTEGCMTGSGHSSTSSMILIMLVTICVTRKYNQHQYMLWYDCNDAFLGCTIHVACIKGMNNHPQWEKTFFSPHYGLLVVNNFLTSSMTSGSSSSSDSVNNSPVSCNIVNISFRLSLLWSEISTVALTMVLRLVSTASTFSMVILNYTI